MTGKRRREKRVKQAQAKAVRTGEAKDLKRYLKMRSER